MEWVLHSPGNSVSTSTSSKNRRRIVRIKKGRTNSVYKAMLKIINDIYDARVSF